VKVKALVLDVQHKMFGNLVLVHHFTNTYTDLVLTAIFASFHQRSNCLNCLTNTCKSSCSRTIAVFNANVEIGLPNVYYNVFGQVVLADNLVDSLPDFAFPGKFTAFDRGPDILQLLKSSIQRGFGGLLLVIDLDIKSIISNRKRKLVGHFVFLGNILQPLADLIFSSQLTTLHSTTNLSELLSCRIQKRLSFPGT